MAIYDTTDELILATDKASYRYNTCATNDTNHFNQDMILSKN